MVSDAPDKSRTALGRYGERLAAEYLRSQGMRVMERNWRCRQGELDLIVMDGPALVVCEVKTRTQERFGTAVEAVDGRKLAKLRLLAGLWLKDHDAEVDQVRIDVVGITVPARGRARVQHLVGV